MRARALVEGGGMSDARSNVRNAKILQITGGTRTTDFDGNIYAGYALVELEIEVQYEDGPHVETRREILPFGTDGGLIGCGDNTYCERRPLQRTGNARPCSWTA
jgi:hypothetical protein